MIQLLGIFLPLAGMVVTLVAWAAMPPGRARAIVLVSVPGLVGVVCMLFASEFAAGGNLLFAVLLIVYLMFASAWYAGLLLVWSFRRARSESFIEPRSGMPPRRD